MFSLIPSTSLQVHRLHLLPRPTATRWWTVVPSQSSASPTAATIVCCPMWHAAARYPSCSIWLRSSMAAPARFNTRYVACSCAFVCCGFRFNFSYFFLLGASLGRMRTAIASPLIRASCSARLFRWWKRMCSNCTCCCQLLDVCNFPISICISLFLRVNFLPLPITDLIALLIMRSFSITCFVFLLCLW